MKHGRNDVEQEAKSLIESRRILGDRLVETWSKVDVGAKLDALYAMDAQKARNTAMALQMQEAHLKKLSETIISQEFQTTPENVLKIVRIGVANSNRGAIFTEYPLQTTDDAIYFVDMTYSKTLRDRTAGQKIFETVDPYYAGEARLENVGAGNGSTTNFTKTFSTIPTVPYSFKLIVGGALVGSDDGSGNIVSSLLTGSNTINYTTGELDITFTTAPASGVDISVEYHWDSERDTLYDQYGTVGLTVSKKRFQARPMPLGYEFSQMVEITLGTTGLGNAEEMLIGAVGDEHSKARDYRAIALAKRVALGNAVTQFNTDFASQGEVSDKSHAQRILSVIDDIGGDIFDDIKRGKVNKAVVGSRALTYLKKHELWVDDISQPRSGVFYAGKLSDIDVFCCPQDANTISNNEIILTYKNPEEGNDIGLAFGVLTELVAQLKYPQFYTVGNIATVEDKMVINDKFCRLLRLTNL